MPLQGLLSPYQILAYLLRAVVVLIAIPFHEAAHALVSHWLGDDTAVRAGRLSLNPMRHFDPLGALCMLVGGVGWARPVGVNPRNYKDPKVGMAVSAAAGPLSNFLLAFVSMILYKIVYYTGAAQAVHVGRAGGHRGYLRPGAVAAAVVHVEYEEVVHLVAFAHLPQQREQPAVGLGQGLLLVVAGHHQGQRHRGSLLSRGGGGLARQRAETVISHHRLKVFAAKIRREFVGNLKTLRGEAESRRAARPRPCRGKSRARGNFR